MKTPHVKLIGRSPLRLGFLLTPLALACLALLPQAGAVCQEGCDTINLNTFLGDDALVNNTTGSENTATGFQALFRNTIGFENTATGFQALENNQTGIENTATGFQALWSNTTGFLNTATGVDALYSNTTGGNNTATGVWALFYNRTGVENTATGNYALLSNESGRYNTATGYNALFLNTIGFQNTATGEGALLRNTTGNNNIALGFQAGMNLTTGNGNIDIGNRGVAGESRIIRIGTSQTHEATFIAGISGATVPTGVTVIVNAYGRLGTIVSAERFKDAIKPMDKASEAILALKPVTFHYKKELDPEGIPQFGLVAEQVEKVNPDLVARDDQGKPYTVRYEAVNAMLLNEFLKEHRKGQEQDATISQLKTELAQQRKDFQAVAAHQQKQIEALTAGLQKVSAQLELGKHAPDAVVTNQ
jgi:hypothetical protein